MSATLFLSVALLRSLPSVLALDDASFADRRPFEIETTVEALIENDTRAVLCADGIRTVADCRGPKPPPPGTVAKVVGETLVDRWGTRLLSVRAFDVRGMVPLPEPQPVSLNRLGEKHLNLCRVAVSGVVEAVVEDETDARWLFIILRDRASRTYLAIPRSRISDQMLAALPSSEISAVGVCIHDHFGRRIHIAQHVCLPGESDIRILRVQAEDPFGVPPVSELYEASQEEIKASGKRRISGFVLATWDGTAFLLSTPGGPPCTVYIEHDGNLPNTGDWITAVGFPETDLFVLNLTSARWRPETPAPAATADTPQDVSARDLLLDTEGEDTIKPEWNGRLCRLRGIVKRVSEDVNGSLQLDCDGHSLFFKAGSGVKPFAGLSVGCTVELTGVCTLRTQHWSPRTPFPHAKGYRFVVRSADDVRILARPPWWTPGRFLAVIAALVAALVGIVVWNRTLNRLANRRGRQLLKEQIARERAQLKVAERNRLAIELHDSLSQNLAAIACQISATKSALNVSVQEAATNLETAERMLLSSRTDLRRCLWDLRGDALDEPNLTTALQKVLKPVIGTARVQVRFNVPRRRLDDSTAHAVICIVRELVSNAVRHGRAANVRVAGDLQDVLLSFSVRDDGCGFTPENRPDTATGHFGLDGIRERAERMNADFTIESSAQCGTRARLSLTLPRPDGKDLSE